MTTEAEKRPLDASVEDAFWEREQLNMVSARLVPPENPDQVVGFLGPVRDRLPHQPQRAG